MKKIMIIIILILIIFIVFFLINKNAGNQIYDNQIILFFSQTCIHCQNVKKFIIENDISQKLVFEEKDVSNSENLDVLNKLAKRCNLSRDISIPFLWNGNSCILGDVDIINFLKEKTKNN